MRNGGYTMFVGREFYDRMQYSLYSEFNNKIKLEQNEFIMSNKVKLDVEFTNKSSAYGHNRIYRIKDESDSTCFRLESIAYPECCGITIFKNASINDVDFNTFGEYLDLIVNDLKDNDRYSKILFYTIQDARLAKLMASYPGCIILDKFKNIRSGNMLVGFEINLFDENSDSEEDEDLLFDEPEEDDEETSDDENYHIIETPSRQAADQDIYSPSSDSRESFGWPASSPFRVQYDSITGSYQAVPGNSIIRK